jgi:hypothetical protein
MDTGSKSLLSLDCKSQLLASPRTNRKVESDGWKSYCDLLKKIRMGGSWWVGGLGNTVWLGGTAMLRCHLAFRFLDFVCLEGKETIFTVSLDISFVDRFLNISDCAATNGRIISKCVRIWKESVVV